MPPSNMITTIHEDEPLNEFDNDSLEGSMPLPDLLASLSTASSESDREKQKGDDPNYDDDMSSIGWFSVTGATAQEVARQKEGRIGRGKGGKKIDRVPAPQSFSEMIVMTKANVRNWIRRKDTWIIIFIVGSLCQLVSGSTNQALAETFQILVSQPNVSQDTAGQDLPLKKFHEKFTTPVLNDGVHQLQTTFHMMDSFSQMILKMARHTDQTWPFVHIPEFEQRTEALLQHHRGTGTLIIKSVALAPLVTRGEMYSFGIFQDVHVDDHSRYQANERKTRFKPLPRASRQLSANHGRMEYHQFVPFQDYVPPGQQEVDSKDKMEWFQIDHIKAALNTIQKTEDPVLLLGRTHAKGTTTNSEGLSSDYILQPILEPVLVKKRLFQSNIHETQVVAVLAAQVQFVEAVQESMKQHFPSLGISTIKQDAGSILVSLKDTCNLEVSYKVAHEEKQPNITSTVHFLGLGTYHKDDWGVASRQVQWNGEQSKKAEDDDMYGATGGRGHSTGTPFCFPDGVEMSLHPTPELHKALSQHFENKIYVLVMLLLIILHTTILAVGYGLVIVGALSSLVGAIRMLWRSFATLMDEQDMESVVSQALIDQMKEINQKQMAMAKQKKPRKLSPKKRNFNDGTSVASWGPRGRNNRGRSPMRSN